MKKTTFGAVLAFLFAAAGALTAAALYLYHREKELDEYERLLFSDDYEDAEPRVVLTVDEHANTSAASIPLALDTGIRRGQIQRGQTLLLEGIGGGFAWGAVLLKY